MHKEAVLGEGVFVIHDFLSVEECAEHVATSERRGYEAALLTTRFGPMLRKDVRDNDRIILDDANLAAQWMQRAASFLPERLGQWSLTGFNERFRYYRYDPGQSFKRHYDASYHRPNGEQSFLTFMVYLNADYTGGTTEFYHPDDRPKATVSPEAGMALVFDHQQVHEGAAVLSGRKYVLRTDIMYRRTR